MNHNNCRYYDNWSGWCSYLSDWSSAMPTIEYCCKGPCPHYKSNGANITTNAKYNIGDEIWFAYYVYDSFLPCKYSGKICAIHIEITEAQQSIYYTVSVDYGDGISLEKYAERVCFPTYEECTKWCEEYNAKFG